MSCKNRRSYRSADGPGSTPTFSPRKSFGWASHWSSKVSKAIFPERLCSGVHCRKSSGNYSSKSITMPL
eukprot:gene26760-35445_t